MQEFRTRFIHDYLRLRGTLKDLVARQDLSPEVRNLAERTLHDSVDVSNGEGLSADQFPHCAAVQGPTDVASGVYLGGNIVLTASHVVRGDAQFNQFSVRLPTDSTTSGAAYQVTCKPLTPPDNSDLAVMCINRTPSLSPIRLATAADFANPDLRLPARGLSVCGFGWGFPPGQSGQITDGLKRMIQVPILQDGVSTFVAGDTTGAIHNVCLDDSGGPAFSFSQPNLLVGIVLGPLQTSGSEMDGCGLVRGATYLNISAYRQWIIGAAAYLGSTVG